MDIFELINSINFAIEFHKINCVSNNNFFLLFFFRVDGGCQICECVSIICTLDNGLPSSLILIIVSNII